MMILEKFWKGEVTPGERRYHHNGEYSKSYQTMVDSEEYLRKHLTGEDLQTFQIFRDAELKLSSLSDFENFVEGFRLGAMFMLDIMEGIEVPKAKSS